MGKVIEHFRNWDEKFWFSLILVILGLISIITWFKPGYLIAGLDYFPPLDPFNAIKECQFIWNPKMGGTSSFTDPVKVFPLYTFWAFFKLFGLDPLITQKLWFIFIFLSSGVSMYYLTSVLMQKGKYGTGRIFAALFYMINPYIISDDYYFQEATILGYIFTPLLLGIFIRGLNKKEGSNKYVILFSIATLLLLTSAANPAVYAIFWLVISAYFIYHICLEGKKKFYNLFFLTKIIGLCILLNLWWIISFSLPLISNVEGLPAGINTDWVLQKSSESSFLNVFRLLGKWAWDLEFRGSPYFPYASSYSTPIMLIVTYLIPILAFSALLFKPKDKRVLFFTILSVVSIFLAKGIHPPLEFINEFLYLHLPGFIIFREPVTKFNLITTLSYAVLIGITTSEVYNYLRKNKKIIGLLASKVFIIFVLLTIFTSGWPLITGDVVIHNRGILHDYHVKIPPYWFEGAEWINSQEGNFKVFLLPQNPFVSVNYGWGYGGVDITRRLVYKPLLTVFPGGQPITPERTTQLLHSTYQTIHSNSTTKLYKLLGLFNVRYILQRNDLDWVWYNMTETNVDLPEHIKSVLSSQKGIHLEETIGKLDFYKIEDEYFVPRIYAASSVFLLKGASIDSPVGIGYEDAVIQDWEIRYEFGYEGNLSAKDGIAYLTLHSNGSHTYSYIRNLEPIKVNPLNYSYLLLRFRSNNASTISVRVVAENGEEQWPYALNPPFTKYQNHYQSSDWYTIAYKLNLTTQIKYVDIGITNALEKSYKGNLELWLDFVKFVKSISPEDEFINTILSEDYTPRNSILVDPADVPSNFSEMIPENNGHALITFQRINPTKYKVKIENATQPFFLVFSESYHKDWIAYVDGQQVPSEYHFMANGYANAWYINKTGTYTVTLEFWPQKLFYIGSAISITTLTISILYIAKDKIKTLYHYLKKKKRSQTSLEHL